MRHHSLEPAGDSLVIQTGRISGEREGMPGACCCSCIMLLSWCITAAAAAAPCHTSGPIMAAVAAAAARCCTIATHLHFCGRQVVPDGLWQRSLLPAQRHQAVVAHLAAEQWEGQGGGSSRRCWCCAGCILGHGTTGRHARGSCPASMPPCKPGANNSRASSGVGWANCGKHARMTADTAAHQGYGAQARCWGCYSMIHVYHVFTQASGVAKQVEGPLLCRADILQTYTTHTLLPLDNEH